MLVSVITPVYNSERYIKRTYESLRLQTHQNWEWLLVDDESKDNSRQIIRDIVSSDARVKAVFSSTNQGAAASRNHALKIARGDMCAFLDSDDQWVSDKLEKQLKFMGSDLDFSFTSYELIDSDSNLLNKQIDCSEHSPVSYTHLLKKTVTLGCSTVMIRRSEFPKLQMPLIRTGQDYACWLSILKQGYHAHLLPQPLTQYRITPNSISRNKVKKAIRQWQIYRELEGLEFWHAAFCFASYAARAITS